MAETSLDRAHAVAERLLANVEEVVLGKTEQVRLVIAALACRGHVLFEDVPGTAKTVLARALAGSIAGSIHSRIQCTPDLQPTDVTGLSVYDQRDREFVFRPGPVFANVVLVDEINRTPPRTQAALLEPMEERQVTVDGITHPMPEPYVVIATENPLEQHGTYPLPEGQLDRFALAVRVGYPDAASAADVVRRQLERHPITGLEQSLDHDGVLSARAAVRAVFVDDAIVRYAIDLVEATRGLAGVALGASPRSSVALVRCAQARALAHERDHVLPDDVKALAVSALAHRLVMTHGGVEAARAGVEQLTAAVPVPLHAARGG
jgi:MoxR-like ATPase